MDNKDLLERNWKAICCKVAIPLWKKKYATMFAQYKLDYDDFESMVGFELSKAIKNYDSTQSSIYTFATNVINKKALSVIRDEGMRLKRRVLSTSISIYTPISEYEEMMVCDTLIVEEDDDITVLTQRYLDSLTAKQRQVAELIMRGYSVKEIKKTMNLSNNVYKMIIANMCDDRKLTPLKKLTRKEIL